MRINRNDLLIPEQRQRKAMDKAKLDELKTSILDHGLLHAPVVQRQENGKFLLVAGERRTRAITLILDQKQDFIHNQEGYGSTTGGDMPVVLLDDALSQTGRAEVELAENIAREELPWQDRMQALAFIHSLKKSLNPDQTYTDTARELIKDGKVQVGAQGGDSLSRTRAEVRRAEIISQHLDTPAISKARNATEAFNLILASEQRTFEAELIRRGQKRITSIEVRHGSLLEILPKLDSGLFDLILSDPPYGIGIDGAGIRSRTVHHHNYDDSPDTTRQLLQCILTEGFRVCKPRANLLLFCDIDFFGWLKEASARAGWDPFRTPITWIKSDSEGMAPWGREGFRRTTEWIFFARKGQKGLIHSPVDVLRHNRVGRADREYGPEKPEPLLRELLAASTLPGDYILDPCCGSGSTLAAARSLNMKALGIELELDAYNMALVKSQKEAQPEGLAAL
jgi:adenine-specific DNA-methyltransferase